ncbi:hypothetical protein H0R94_00845 [Treponema socranskii]|uniref:hypothetical protein n=1 Tax=Treponema socranskii TaxID=53419 RepID=UPI003D8D88D2
MNEMLAAPQKRVSEPSKKRLVLLAEFLSRTDKTRITSVEHRKTKMPPLLLRALSLAAYAVSSIIPMPCWDRPYRLGWKMHLR